ncbi:MAG: iron-only hydrogenase system regulator [Clostridia bacterium]|nr:iron-only hydrogenase system regulator [Clostridia bacterium]
MKTQIAIVGIIVDNIESVPDLNFILSDYGDYIVGRQGVPYHKKKVNIISIIMDATEETIKELEDKVGKLKGVSSFYKISQFEQRLKENE